MAATWGQGISLKGRDGQPGLSIIQAEGPPASGLVGADKQLYVDTASASLDYYVYSTSSSAWTKQGILRGPMGLMGLDAQLFFGDGAPDTTTYSGDADALFIQNGTGKVYKYDKATGWVDAGFSFKGPAGADGVGRDGLRGTQTYTGSGAPSSNLSSFSPPAVAGDLYYDLSGGPTLYVLGS